MSLRPVIQPVLVLKLVQPLVKSEWQFYLVVNKGKSKVT